MRFGRFVTLLLLTAAAACAVAPAATAIVTIVVPSPQANVEGDIANSFPFDLDGIVSSRSQRYQQVHDASEFAGPISIGAIWFRPDAGAG